MAFSATYSPQDDKIRLFFGGEHIPKPEWDRLKAAGFTWTMKQDSDMVGLWTPAREDIALDMCGDIEDEDQPREERAADRAERFEGYRDKREGEAVGLADRFDNGPAVHGNQSLARATRAAARHDRIGGHAVNQWAKAEYWQRRTAGVIAHALYLEQPAVRHRRIKGLEADLHKLDADSIPSSVVKGVEYVRRYCGEEAVAKGHNAVGMFGQGRAKHPRSFDDSKPLGQGAYTVRVREHLGMRIAYEKQMLIGQGGTLADVVEMVPGGFIGKHQIQKVTKDRAGRVSKLYFLAPTNSSYDRNGKAYDDTNPPPLSLHAIDAERMKPGSYRAPTAEEAAAFVAGKKEAAKGKPKAPPLINPTPEQAQKLQAHWNAASAERFAKWGGKEASTVCPMPQEAYSAKSGGDYAICKTVDVCADWSVYSHRRNDGSVAFRVRTHAAAYMGAARVVILTDKPQSELPAIVAPVAVTA